MKEVWNTMNPLCGEGIVQKYAPAVVVLVWLAVNVAVIFGVTATGPQFTVAFNALTGAAGWYLRGLSGAKPSS